MLVDIDIVPRVSFSYSEVILGCDADDLESKPYAAEYDNQFIRDGRGKRVIPAKEDNDDYIDIHRFYHRMVGKKVSRGTHYSMAFRIKTGSPGIYPFKVSFIGDEVEGTADTLFITVENIPQTLMRYVTPDHQNRSCAKGIASSPQSFIDSPPLAAAMEI